MSTLTMGDVRELLGDLDDLDVARIISTGASIEELREAAAEVEIEDEMGEPALPPSSGQVTRLRSLIEEILEPDMYPEEERS